MINYMKSEFYRILHGKTIYILTGIISVLALFMNLVLYWFSTYMQPFQYGSVRFAFLQPITGMVVFYIGGLLVVMLLSTDEYKYGVLKNAVAGGISRNGIFIGKCIVYGVTAVCSAAVILAVFISSAYGLLEWNPAVPMDSTIPLHVLLTGVAANLLFSLASVVLAVALNQIFQKENTVYAVWLFVICLIPETFQMLGYKIPFCARIAGWMPWIFLNTEVDATFTSRHMDALWMHPEGFLKLIIVGVIGIVVFGAVGILGFRKKDVA